MNTKTVILVAEDDKGHYELVKRNLWLTCVNNEILHFGDGQKLLDFLFENDQNRREKNSRYILLLDIRMPKVDGYEVLRRIRQDPNLRAMPVIMLTTTSDVAEIDRCYKLGCNFYVVKPVNYNKFMQAVESLGSFLSLEGIMVPQIESDEP